MCSSDLENRDLAYRHRQGEQQKTHERTEGDREEGVEHGGILAFRIALHVQQANELAVRRADQQGHESENAEQKKARDPGFGTHVNESRIDERADGQQDAQANEGFPEREGGEYASPSDAKEQGRRSAERSSEQGAQFDRNSGEKKGSEEQEKPRQVEKRDDRHSKRS